MGGPSSTCGCPARLPDYVQFALDAYVFSFSGTFSRSGNSFFGGGPVRQYPNPLSIGASASGGWLHQCYRPSNQQVDDFIGGVGLGVAGAYVGIGGGFTWSPGNGTATQIGIGAGFSASASVQYNQGSTGLGGW